MSSIILIGFDIFSEDVIQNFQSSTLEDAAEYIKDTDLLMVDYSRDGRVFVLSLCVITIIVLECGNDAGWL